MIGESLVWDEGSRDLCEMRSYVTWLVWELRNREREIGTAKHRKTSCVS